MRVEYSIPEMQCVRARQAAHPFCRSVHLEGLMWTLAQSLGSEVLAKARERPCTLVSNTERTGKEVHTRSTVILL
jgi:hypothetical protein